MRILSTILFLLVFQLSFSQESIEEKMNIVKKYFESKDYHQTIKNCDNILALDSTFVVNYAGV
jgi:hypothetical protein